jgi:hypothetical protein
VSLSALSPDFDKPIQSPIKLLASYRHLYRIKGILHHKVCIQLIYLLEHRLSVWLLRFREQQKLGSCKGLETLDAELRGFKDFEASGAGMEWCGEEVGGWCWVGGGVWTELARYCVHAKQILSANT